MNTIEAPDKPRRSMEVLVLVGFLAVWLVLQIWVLPKFGVQS